MLFFLSSFSKKRRSKKTRNTNSDTPKKFKEDNSRKLVLSHRHKREAIRVKFGLEVSDRRRRRDDAMRRLDGSIQQMKSLPSVDIRGNIRIRPHFDKPQKTGVCIRRAVRRKVLFASGKAGKIKVKKALWTNDSKVVCK